MDSGVIITTLIIIALCSFPFWLISIKRKKSENQLLQTLTYAANKQGCKITRHEICGDYAIGMDEGKGFVFFKRKSEKQADALFIDLSKVKSCEMTHAGRTIKGNGDSYQVIDQLDLCFKPKEANAEAMHWIFFSAENHMQLDGELQSIEKWEKLIKEWLKRNS